MRFATYTTEGATYYGAVTEDGMIPLSPNFAQWPTLRDVIAADGLHDLAKAAQGRVATHVNVTYQVPIPNPKKI